jgi:hypothetical protein
MNTRATHDRGRARLAARALAPGRPAGRFVAGLVAGLVLTLGVGLGARPAAAETLTVGMFAPSAPFSGTGARLAFATRLAEHLARATGASRGVGRVYTQASDFASAVRRGSIDFALVDEAYLATSGADYRVLAAAVHRGSARVSWQLVGRGDVRAVGELQGKRIIVPGLGGREDDFVIHVLFGSEITADFFGAIETAPDALSAVATLGLQRADGACVPAGVPLPAGVTRLTDLASTHWPLLVALPGTSDTEIDRAFASLSSFAGDDVFTGFEAADAEVYQGMARRLRGSPRQGPLVPVPVSVFVAELLRDVALVIQPSDPLRYLDLPATPASAAPPAPGATSTTR